MRTPFQLALFALLALPLLPAAHADPDRITLDVWDYPRIPDAADPHDRFAWLHSLARAFERSHPGVRVHVTELTWQHGEEKLKVAALAGAPPDVSSGPIPLAFVERGLVRPVDADLSSRDREDYLPAAMDGYSYGGHIWGFPWCLTGSALFLNLDLFAAAGVAPPGDGRWTFDAMVESAQRLTGHGRFGLGIALEPGRNAEYGFLTMDGGRPLVTDSGVTDATGRTGGAPAIGARATAQDNARSGQAPPRLGLTEQGMLSAVRALAALMEPGGVMSPECAGFQEKDVWESFLERQTVAIVPAGIWAVGALARKATFHWGIAHFPTRPGHTSASMVAVSGFYVFRRDDAARERMAVELARFITSGENERLLKTYRQVPARRSAGDLYAHEPMMRRAVEVVAQGEPLPAHPAWPQIDERLMRTLQSTFSTHADPDRTLGQLAQELAPLLTREVPPETPPRREGAGEIAMPALPPELGILALLGLAFAVGLGIERRAAPFRRPSREVSMTALALALPASLAVVVFFLLPALRGLLFAFQDVGASPPLLGHWVGLENFRRVLATRSLGAALYNTLLYTAVVVPLNVGIALVLAALLRELGPSARTFFKGAFYLPSVASVVVMAMVWRWLLDANFGLINRLLGTGIAYQAAANALAVTPQLGWIVLALGVPLAAWALCTLALERRVTDPFLRDRWSRIAAWPIGGCAAVGLLWALAPVPFGPQPVAPIQWLTGTKLAMVSIMMTTVLRGPGGALIVYLAAMASQPRELAEAARVDGAGALATFWYVTVPALRPTTLYLVITQTIDSFQVFAQVLLLTDGGPADASVVLVHKLYTLAFRDLDFGGASALALLMMLALCALSLGQLVLLSRRSTPAD